MDSLVWGRTFCILLKVLAFPSLRTHLRSQIRIPGMVPCSVFYGQPTRILDSRVLSKHGEQWAKPQYIWLLYWWGLASGFGKGITDYQEDYPAPCLEACLKKTQKFLLCYCFCCFVSVKHHSPILLDTLRTSASAVWIMGHLAGGGIAILMYGEGNGCFSH